MGFDENLITKSILLKEIERGTEKRRERENEGKTNYKGYKIWSVNVERSLMSRKRE